MPKWIATVLSGEQQQPILRTSPNACVLAGAGSGKTRTLVHMLLSDLERGVSPEGIVAFTFTEKAALHPMILKSVWPLHRALSGA